MATWIDNARIAFTKHVGPLSRYMSDDEEENQLAANWYMAQFGLWCSAWKASSTSGLLAACERMVAVFSSYADHNMSYTDEVEAIADARAAIEAVKGT